MSPATEPFHSRRPPSEHLIIPLRKFEPGPSRPPGQGPMFVSHDQCLAPQLLLEWGIGVRTGEMAKVINFGSASSTGR